MERILEAILSNGLVAAIIGALAGGITGYKASVRLENLKTQELNQRLFCLLMPEIYGHQAALANTLDDILPCWLYRGKIGLFGEQDRALKSLNIVCPKLKMKCFNTFLDKMVRSDLLALLIGYYAGVEQLNLCGEDWKKYKKDKRDQFFYKYLPLVRDVLEASIMIMKTILRTNNVDLSDVYQKTKLPYFTEWHHIIVEDFNDKKERYRCMIELTKLKYTHLYELRHFKECPTSFNGKLNYSPDRLNEIPDIIIQTNYWRTYLKEDAEA